MKAKLSDLKPGLFIADGKRWSGSDWFQEVMEINDEFITLCLYDCGYVKPLEYTYSAVQTMLIRGGLWQRVGIYSFAPFNDPAAGCIRFAEQYPQAAGRELYELRCAAAAAAATTKEDEK